MEKIGFLHPGQMGVSVAASARHSGHTACWASEGRSAQTRERAAQHALTDLGSLAALCRKCTLIVSICPPDAAEAVARQVAEQDFHGLYVDANAISPQRAVAIGARLAERGVAFVDGGIIGGPAWKPGETWLYLSGAQAERVAACFAAGPLQTKVLGADIGQASALKMCYAAYTKGATALLCAALGAAEGLGVRADLERQWERDQPGSVEQNAQRVRRVTAKAWRFAGEMDEIAATFAAAGLPGGFHQAAADIYRRLADFKGQAASPSTSRPSATLGTGGAGPELAEVLAALLTGPAGGRDAA